MVLMWSKGGICPAKNNFCCSCWLVLVWSWWNHKAMLFTSKTVKTVWRWHLSNETDVASWDVDGHQADSLSVLEVAPSFITLHFLKFQDVRCLEFLFSCCIECISLIWERVCTQNAVMSLTVSLKELMNTSELRIPDGGEDVLPPAAHFTKSHCKSN